MGLNTYVQNNPTTNPFGADDALLGFPQQLSAGSQVGSINNTVVLTPTITWEQRVGFTRLRAYAASGQAFSPSDIGINLLGSTIFPQISITNVDPTLANSLQFGPGPAFGNAGMFQNQWEYGTTLHWIKGRHTLAFGMSWDHTQLNIINHNTETDNISFRSLLDFVEGNVKSGVDSTSFSGSANRYYRSDTAGAFVNDNYKLRSNLTVTLGLRWDFDGPLSEKYDRLTGFNGNQYSYDAATDTITNSGLEIAGTNGASDTLMKNHQWGFAPRIGIAWNPIPKLTVRTGFGIYYDRGEFFSYLSPSAGGGYNGPFGVTLEPPFVQPIVAQTGATFQAPFGTTPPAPPAGTGAAFQALLPNIAQTESGNFPAGNLFGPFLFGGYDINNKLPYTENWTFDLQYQAANDWLFSAGYIGNHGVHEILPIAFNQPNIATPQHPVNGQIYSYGGVSPNYNLDLEPISTSEYAGNAPIRVPYIGYDMNSVLFKAEGVSSYNALQLQVRKRLSNGLQFTASYTWSHTLDEQSGLGLFYTGNNPLDPKSGYATADFDRTHVFLINYSYAIPKLTSNKALGAAINGWIIGGQTVAQSGEPYSIYDFSGSVGSLYFGTSNYIGNPIVPLAPGVTVQQAQLQGTTGVNAGKPVLNVNDFLPQFVAPGTNGVPPCDASGCDLYESLYGSSGRNIFRAPFEVRFDMTLGKEFVVNDRFRLRFNFDAFNVFNHPDFDAPNNNVTFFPNFSGPPSIPPQGSLGIIQHTLGSSRFLQLSMHLRVLGLRPLGRRRSRDHLRMIQRRDQRDAAEHISDQRRKHVAADGRQPGFGPGHHQKEHFHRSRHDVREPGQAHNVGHQDDNRYPVGIRCGQHPHHHRDQPSGEDAAQNGVAERHVRCFGCQLSQREMKLCMQHRRVADHPRENVRSSDVRRQNNRPQAQHLPERRQIAAGEKRNDRSQRILREKLLPSHNDNEKAQRIAEIGDQRPPGNVRYIGSEQSLADKRESHRESRRQPGPG